jgi:hypothetical protein
MEKAHIAKNDIQDSAHNCVTLVQKGREERDKRNSRWARIYST